MSGGPIDQPKAQAGAHSFQPGYDLLFVRPAVRPAVPAAAPQTTGLSFTQAAEAGGTDRDVLMGYQLFLGRDPENSFVIVDAKSSPVGAFIRGLMGSGEFQSAVLDRLGLDQQGRGRALPHEAASASPSPEQTDWLFRLIALPDAARAALRSATGWRDWLRALVAVPGFPGAPGRAAKAAADGIAAHAADEGFVLVHLEQPMPGDLLASGTLVQGSGWAIAPADVAEITVHLDAILLTHARYGLPRPDIARRFPHYRHVDHCGFAFIAAIPAAAVLTAASQLIVSVRTVRGEIGRRAVRMLPPAAAAPESGIAATGPDSVRAWPIRLAVNDVTAAGRILRIRGWAASTATMHGVTVSLGDDALGNAQTGLPRPDIAGLHPSYPNAALSGFVLVYELPPDLPGGPGFVRVQAEDADGLTRHVIVPVDLPWVSRTDGAENSIDGATSDRDLANGCASVAAGMRLEVDRPMLDGPMLDGPMLSGRVVHAPLHGALTVEGWAVARDGVAAVTVYCDEELLGHAHLGMRREDIGAAYPDYQGALLAGYALVLPPGTLPPGGHRIRVVATAAAGDAVKLAVQVERSFRLTVEPYDALPPGGGIRTRIPPAEIACGLAVLTRMGVRPAFEIVVDSRSGTDGLAGTLASLAGQAYPDWQATVKLAGRHAASDLAVLALQAASRGRVTLTWPRKAAPATKTGLAGRRARKAAAGASPRFAMRLRPGDRLGADALLTFAIAAGTAPQSDFIYADELRDDPAQQRRQPSFKPDWSPDLLLATNYVGRSWCACAALARSSGLSRAATDYETVLRLTERAASIHHVARVLCDRGATGDTPAEEMAALQAALIRREVDAEVLPGAVPGTRRVQRALVPPRSRRGLSATAAASRVSIIMPTCAARGLVRTAIRTIRATTARALPGGPEVEIVVLDNTQPTETGVQRWLRANADVVIAMPGAFNWSAFNNAGARAATGAFLLFLNDDIEAGEPGWLEAMLEHAQRPEVGVVGARLLYPDGTVQHGGQYLAGGHARHAFRFARADSPGPSGLATVAREVISVTGACQMVRAETFRTLGGFEEAHGVVNNDVDFCLRSWSAGLSVVFTPHATLVHHELASRAALVDSYDEVRFAAAWGERFLRGDPFRNPRLDPIGDDYGPDPEPVETVYAGRRGPAVAAIRRILAVKLDHIGDFLTALPALRALAKRFPNAVIDLLAPAATAELARSHLTIGQVIVFDFFHARSGEGSKGLGEAEFQALHARLAPARYDLAIDLRLHPDTRAVLPYTGAAFLAGYDHAGAFPFLDVALEWEGDRQLAAKRAHISERLVQLVSAAADACGGDPRSRPSAALAASAVPALAKLPAAFLARPLVCIHPGVGNAIRQWPAVHYAALIDLLAAHGLHALLIGGPDEAGVADEVLRRVSRPGAAESLVGQVKLAQLGGVMRACRLFVGNNSGPQHLAASLGLPTIGIHSGVVDAAEWAPLGPLALALRRPMVCSPCYLEFAADCPRNLECLTGLRPAEVFAACLPFLQGLPAAQ